MLTGFLAKGILKTIFSDSKAP